MLWHTFLNNGLYLRHVLIPPTENIFSSSVAGGVQTSHASRVTDFKKRLRRSARITVWATTGHFKGDHFILNHYIFFHTLLAIFKTSSLYSFNAFNLSIWIPWPARDYRSLVSYSHWSVSLPLFPLLSWLSGRNSGRVNRTKSTRAYGWAAVAARDTPANFMSPSWNYPVSSTASASPPETRHCLLRYLPLTIGHYN